MPPPTMEPVDRRSSPEGAANRPAETLRLGPRLVRLAGADLTRPDFLLAACRELVQRTGAESVQLWAPESERWLNAWAHHEDWGVESHERPDEPSASALCALAGLEPVGWDHGLFAAESTTAGSSESTVLVPIPNPDSPQAWLVVTGSGPDYVIRRTVEALVRIAADLAIALDQQRLVAALRERVKELTCLMELSRLESRPDAELADVLERIATLLPRAWQYPEAAIAGIAIDGIRAVAGATGRDPLATQSAEVVTGERRRGRVWVGYVEERVELDEGPFLSEERDLLEAVARQVGALLERRDTRTAQTRLEAQLRHADRLATIGTLSAGVAHELNEPIGAVLGFAQLARQAEGLPEGAVDDLGKIEAAALHARDIVRQLMLFARQAPTEVQPVDLNSIVQDALSMLASRCRSRHIVPETDLAGDLTKVSADRAQLQQVVVNLTVNAIQAMPDGGRLKVVTRGGVDGPELLVEDSGAGMGPEVAEKMFLPFFTTKEVNEGTGLGLAVVHGIVTAHGGTISVDSEPGRGTRVTVGFPNREVSP